MAVVLPESMHLLTWGANWRSLRAIRVHFGPHGTVLRRHFVVSAALGTKYESLVWALLQKTAVYAQNREMALPFWNRIICCWGKNCFK